MIMCYVNYISVKLQETGADNFLELKKILSSQRESPRYTL